MHQSMGLLTRSMFVSSLLALATIPVTACVDPQQDFNDYAARTADAHAPPPLNTVSDAATDAPLYAPDASFSSTMFFESCLTGQANGNVSEANGSVASMTFTPKPGGGGTLTFTNTPLKIGATSLTQTSGMSSTASPATIAPDGSGTATFGQTIIPADANPVSNMQLTLSMSTLSFHVESETQICANLHGTVVEPAAATVTGPCIFAPISGNGPLPTFQLSDYHCP